MNKYTITSIMILLSSSSLAQDSCMVSPSCESLGYTKSATDCVGKKAISCPFDTTLFYCPESGFSEYPLETCPDGGVCSELTQYKLDSCQNSYEISSDGLTCNACNFIILVMNIVMIVLLGDVLMVVIFAIVRVILLNNIC
ncbi:MAG: hypothetical protein E7012_07125 [Alphaproteobacteria bacterium]|nr:hypothetical protein [Alphaproteobacteria bacterium]